MHCLVTAGPTFESLDAVRRLTNLSTGRLGSELASFLAARGHEVTLLVGQQATYCGERRASQVETFTSTAHLRERLRARAGLSIGAVFHAAAVSDFTFGRIWRRLPEGQRAEDASALPGRAGVELVQIQSGKIPTRQGPLLAELLPTPKIIAELRDWFPRARLVGWKYEVEGGRPGVIRLAAEQMAACRTDACVANGPAYGPGFGWVRPGGRCAHLPDPPALFEVLERFARAEAD